MAPVSHSGGVAFAKHFAVCAALALCASIYAGCVLDPASPETGAASVPVPVSGAVQRDPAQARPGVPEGCTLEWDAAAMDSALNCPDIRPPAPK